MQRLTEAPTTSAFLDAPENAYICGPHYLYFQAGPKLTGYILWGTPNADDLDAIERLIIASNARLGEHPSLVDARALDGAEVLVFDRMSAFIREHREVLRASLTRLAVVHGEGMTGALVAGFFAVVEPPYPVGQFSSLEAALGWLRDPAPAPLAAQLESIRDAASCRPALLRQLEALAIASLPDPCEEVVARALGLSKRTLQRRLGELGTTFTNEVAQARARRAVLLLETTEDPLGRIADEVGCASVSTLSVLVKKWSGATPSEIRGRSR